MQGKYYLKITKNTFFLESSPPFKFDYDLPKPGTKWIFLQNLPTCRNICSIKLTKNYRKLLFFDLKKKKWVIASTFKTQQSLILEEDFSFFSKHFDMGVLSCTSNHWILPCCCFFKLCKLGWSRVKNYYILRTLANFRLTVYLSY